jgi:hypothetical protein
MLFASKHFCRSAGVVASREGGPRRPELQTQTSNRPKEFRISSMRVRVSGSDATVSGYGIIFVLGEDLEIVSIRGS